jgi:thioredoxin 2
MTATSMDDRGFIVMCPSCGQKNRIAFAATDARCGKCRTTLPRVAEPVEVPDADAFDRLVKEHPQPVVVDFWAPWCGPCRMVAPELVKVAAAHSGEFLIAKVNTDAVPELGDRFQIRSIPTMAVFQGGREVARTAGARPAAQIEAFVQEALSAHR